MLLQPQGLVNGTGTAVAIQNHHSSFHLEPLLEQQPHTHSNPIILSEQSHRITLRYSLETLYPCKIPPNYRPRGENQLPSSHSQFRATRTAFLPQLQSPLRTTDLCHVLCLDSDLTQPDRRQPYTAWRTQAAPLTVPRNEQY
jgi:hypothetical protein